MLNLFFNLKELYLLTIYLPFIKLNLHNKMKKLYFLLVIVYVSFSDLYSQCNVNAFSSPDTIVCGSCATLSAFGSATGNIAFQEDFNGGSPIGWQFTQSVTIANNTCGLTSPDGSDFMWMGDAAVNPRDMTTVGFDLSLGGTICFDMVFATQGDASPCEGPDEPDEGVFVQYSIDNGATWIDIQYWDPNGGNDPQLTNWNTYCITIPAGAQTSNTMIQWHQDDVSGSEYDHWGIDNVQITLNDPNYTISWLHDGYSYGLGNPGGDNPTDVCITTTTSYTVQMTDGTNTCTDVIEVVVVDPVLFVNAGNDTTICPGDCANLNGEAYEIISPAKTPTFSNSETDLIAGTPMVPIGTPCVNFGGCNCWDGSSVGFGGQCPPEPGSINAEMNINVQNMNQTNVGNGFITSVCVNSFNITPGVGCTATSLADIEIVLVCPDGTEVILANTGSLSGNTINNMCFELGAAPYSTGSAPYTGTFAPANSWIALNGCTSNGVWTMIMRGVNMETCVPLGSIGGWSISFDDPQITGPANYAWTSAANLTNPTSLNPNFCPTATETFTLSVTDINNCLTVTDDVTVTLGTTGTAPCGTTPDPCVSLTNEGCGSGGYVWEYELTDGGEINITTLTPAGSWQVSYDNGITWSALTAPTIINTQGDVWILSTDPDPTDQLNFSLGEWSHDDCTGGTTNITAGHDCILDGCPNCVVSTGCVTAINEGCGFGGYVWEYEITAGGEINVTTLTPPGAWEVSYDNGATWSPLTAPTTITNTGDVWFLSTDPDPADFFDFSTGEWNYDDCTTGATNISAGHDCILDGCNCTTPEATFNASATTICEGDCINFTNTSSNIPAGALLAWNFPGATPANSTTNSPTNICYATAGSYWVTLVYTDATFNLIDSTGMVITVTTCAVDPPVANFNATATSICEGDCIDFNDLSTSTAVGGITDWSWDFGNGQTSTLQNPTNICYATAGNYTVSLTVTDANGSHTETFTNYIETTVCSGPQPVADFSATNTILCTGDCIDFTDLSTSSAVGGITSWSWNFGNGQTSTLQNPTNICYATAGNYTITLTVSDANGNNTQTLSNYIEVSVCTTPNASFNVTPSTTICEGDCIGFVNTSTAVPPGAVVGWNFPGATPTNSTQNSPNNICYPTAGIYWATLVIADGTTFAVIDSTGVAITVTTCTPPIADFTYSPAGPFCEGDCITFTSNSTYTSPATFLWDFGNGQTNLTETPGAPICFNDAGSYNVSLTVSDANGSNTQTQTIEILDCTPPNAGFTMSDNVICEGQCIFFNNTSTNGTFYQWTFEGGTPPASYLPFPGNVCFEEEGDYTITLVAGNAYGSDTITSQVSVNPSPNVTTSEDQLIYSSQEVQISASSSDPNVSYIWSPTEWLYCPDCAVTTVAPEDTILYTVTVTNSFGCSDSSNVLIEVIYIEEIGVPTAFSPNGDGHNDVLYVQGAGIKNMVFRVFNRYGQMVFESTDQEYGWDGTFQGKDLNPGVFVYYVQYDNSTSEDNILEGNVTLIR